MLLKSVRPVTTSPFFNPYSIWLFVVIPAPYFHRIADNRSIKAFVDGVSAAAAGAIGGAAIVLGRRAIYDVPTIVIAIVTFGVLWKLKKVPERLGLN